MIHWIKGNCRERTARGLLVEVRGVGIFIETPLTTLKNFQGNGEEIELWTHMQVSEDAMRLFGFESKVSRDAFQVLISVSGIGPKLALAVISTLNIKSIIRAIEANQPELLETVPGIGRRTAERLIVELKAKKLEQLLHLRTSDHIDQEQQDLISINRETTGPLESDALHDLRSALDNLGFKEKDYSKIIGSLGAAATKMDFPQLVKYSLQMLAPGGG